MTLLQCKQNWLNLKAGHLLPMWRNNSRGRHVRKLLWLRLKNHLLLLLLDAVLMHQRG